jgi:hypothetical protein
MHLVQTEKRRSLKLLSEYSLWFCGKIKAGHKFLNMLPVTRWGLDSLLETWVGSVAALNNGRSGLCLKGPVASTSCLWGCWLAHEVLNHLVRSLITLWERSCEEALRPSRKEDDPGWAHLPSCHHQGRKQSFSVLCGAEESSSWALLKFLIHKTMAYA